MSMAENGFIELSPEYSGDNIYAITYKDSSSSKKNNFGNKLNRIIFNFQIDIY